jgi:hypothetical protein
MVYPANAQRLLNDTVLPQEATGTEVAHGTRHKAGGERFSYSIGGLAKFNPVMREGRIYESALWPDRWKMNQLGANHNTNAQFSLYSRGVPQVEQSTIARVIRPNYDGY